MLKRYEVQVLRRAGHSQSEVAHLTGVSIRAIRRIEREGPAERAPSALAERRHRLGRPSRVEAFRSSVVEQLAEDPFRPSLEILRRVQTVGYSGSRSPMYALIAELRASHGRKLGAERVPGVASEHDFGEAEVQFANGATRTVCFLVSQLVFSSSIRVSMVENLGVEAILRGLVAHFASLGGVPLVAILRRSKPLLGARAGQTVWDWAVAQLALELGSAITFKPSRGGSRALERPGPRVRARLLERRVFAGMDDLATAVARWEAVCNASVGATTREDDRRRLRPLPWPPADFALRIPAGVRPDATVAFAGVSYSVPRDAIGKLATLHVYGDRVRVSVGRHVIEYQRAETTRPHDLRD
ncbi:MAG: hypothetical protein FWD17_00605 [Polyangiaceae bacterium]|nr:hypothetical protein [Polyangiaceae bacterium]